MEELTMSINTKLEVAVEILAAKIAIVFGEGYTVNDEKMKSLLKEREKLYSCDEEIIDKIISVYGPEVKKKYEGA
ncbi:MAG: hypothetical protein FWF46_07905 [Oscillospiraceae bacterium]|nr:hypothetical protein [Oscillospiraceae bacterium]